MCQPLICTEGKVVFVDNHPTAVRYAQEFGEGPFDFREPEELPPHISRLETGLHYLIAVDLPHRTKRTKLPLRLFRIIPAPVPAA